MNILIPHTWLLEHVDTKVSPEEIARCLSLCGPSVERIHTFENEPVYDIEVTTNRVDMMSVRGIARETATILPEFGYKAALKPMTFPHLKTQSTLPPLQITITNDPKLCKRIIAIHLSGVEINPSSPIIQKRLKQVGQRPVNNIVDITNYIMWEYGHPIHAFDLDRLQHNTVIVREAKAGEVVITLDGKQHALMGGEVVFDDGTGTIIDLPGLMGTKNTAVTSDTTNVLLWIESIDARKIRQASMNLNIRTQAAVLNEKHVDPELGLDAIGAASFMVLDSTKGVVASRLVDLNPKTTPPAQTILSQHLIDTYLGISLTSSQITRILTALGCGVKTEKNQYNLTPPSYRMHDLQLPVDYIEEIARIYGYHKLESQLMATPIPHNPPRENFRFEKTVKQWLAGWGATEVYTYSMISEDLATKSGISISDHIRIKNPYSSEWVFLRQRLTPSLATVLSQNQNQENIIFEMQNTYQKLNTDYTLPKERYTLAIVTNKSYRILKGMVDALMEKLHTTATIVPTATNKLFKQGKAGEIWINDRKVGEIGEYGSMPYAACELDVYALEEVSSTHPKVLPTSTFSPIIEDLTFTLPKGTYTGQVIETIKSVDPRISSVTIKSVYNQNTTFTITYHSHETQLSDQDIAPLREKVVSTLVNNHQATLVGTLS